MVNFLQVKTLFVRICAGFIPNRAVRKQWRTKHIDKASENLSTADYGFGNKIILKDKSGNRHSVREISGLRVTFKGSNSMVEISEPCNFNNCDITLGDNSCVKIGGTKFSISNFRISKLKDAVVVIGENFSCIGCNVENHDESGLNIEIGEDCQFSYGIKIRASDGHAIYDNTTKEILNKPSKGIKIGNHVWLAADVVLLKDTKLSDNTIVGAKSLVTKTFSESNVILAGIPAKVIRRNVNWDRKNTQDFESETALSCV